MGSGVGVRNPAVGMNREKREEIGTVSHLKLQSKHETLRTEIS